MSWEQAEKVQKNESGQFRAFIGGEWVPVAKAQKSAEGQFRVERGVDAKPAKSQEQIGGEMFAAAKKDWREDNPIKAGAADFASGASDLMRGGVNLVKSGLGDKIWPDRLSEDGALKIAGQLADPVAWTVGGGIAKALPYAPVLGQGLLKGIGAVGRNAGTGAVAGGAIGALSDSGTAEGGAVGGAIGNVVLPPVIGGVARGAGRAYDALLGRGAAARAGIIGRDVAGNDLTALKAALANASPDQTAAQASAGLKNDPLAALGGLAQAHDRTSFFSRKAELEKQAALDEIRRISGGANQTEAKKVAQASQDALNRITTPMREDVLTQANIAGKTGLRLQEEADSLGNAATSKVADVRRMERAGDVAEDLADVAAKRHSRSDSGNPAAQSDPTNSYARVLERFAEKISKQSADDSLLLGQGAKFKQMQIQSLADAGFKPLSGSAIIAQLKAKIADPNIGSETLKEKVLTNVLNRFEHWTKGSGVIDAAAVYGIRKSAVNDAIDQLMSGADPASKSKAAAGILKQVKPIIDDALGKASGNPKGWQAYLDTFGDGMKVVNQQKMGAKLLEILERNPKRFMEMAKGNEPQAVAKRFGGEYDIRAVMGDKMGAIDRVASMLQSNDDLKKAAKRGAGGLQDILVEHQAKFKLWNVLDPKVAMINRALGEVEVKLNKSTFNKLMESQTNPKLFLKILNTVPAAERMQIVESLARQSAGTVGGIVGGQTQNTEEN